MNNIYLKMFQATMTQVQTFRKIIDSLKDLVSEVNLEASSGGITISFIYCRSFTPSYG